MGGGVDVAAVGTMGAGGDGGTEAGKIGAFDAGRKFEAGAEFAIARAIDRYVD